MFKQATTEAIFDIHFWHLILQPRGLTIKDAISVEIKDKTLL